MFWSVLRIAILENKNLILRIFRIYFVVEFLTSDTRRTHFSIYYPHKNTYNYPKKSIVQKALKLLIELRTGGKINKNEFIVQ
jgi:hypothetical protein